MTVDHIMTRKVISVTPDTPLNEVAGLLFDKHVTGVPVVDPQNKVVGIITEYDLMSPQFKIHIPTFVTFLESLSKHDSDSFEYKDQVEKFSHVRARDIMTREVITVHPETSISTLVETITSKRINPVPVVDAVGKLVGIVSRADLVKLLK